MQIRCRSGQEKVRRERRFRRWSGQEEAERCELHCNEHAWWFDLGLDLEHHLRLLLAPVVGIPGCLERAVV